MDLEKKIRKLLEESIRNKVFPSVSVGVSYGNIKNKKKCIVYSGNINNDHKKELKEDTFFDLASLTKPFATVLSLLSLLKERKISIKDQLIDIFNEELPIDKRNIRIEQLLSHTAGFPAHREYYKKLVEVKVEQRKELLLKLLLNEPLLAAPGRETLYSDPGYMLIGLLLEKVSGLEIDEYFSEKITAPIGLEEHVFYKSAGKKDIPADRFAPVEYCPWRGRLLRGEVSDENCWALGGVAGHAGLYGDIKGVLELSELILDIWLGKREHPNLNRQELVSFLTRRSAITRDTWALGFDRPSPAGASCGKYLSTESIGHLGFTGTSFWLDPERELVIVILSNRVHPSRDNLLIKKFRPEFHNQVVKWLGVEKIGEG
jgi:CubicO group peptidase (beta-lactamase class C family)